MKASIKHKLLWQAFTEFYLFNPKKQSLAFCLMLIQGLTGGIGILLIIPMLSTIGISTGTTTQTLSNSIHNAFNFLSIPINLTTILVSYVSVITLLALLRFALTVLGAQLQQHYISHLRTTLYRQLLNCQWQFILKHKMSSFIHTLSAQVQGVGHGANLMLNFASQITLTLVLLALVLMLSWKMTLIALTLSSITVLLLLPLNKKLHNSGQTELKHHKVIFQMLTEHLNSLKMIKSFASEEQHAKKISTFSTSVEQQQLQLVRINAFTQLIYMVSAVCLLSILFYISWEILAIELDTVLLLFIVFARLLPQITALQRTYQQLSHKAPTFADIAKSRQTFIDAQEEPATLSPTPNFNEKITLKNITFKYDNKALSIINNLDLTIKKNETWALVGPSGAGKTTIVDMLAGLLVPNQGKMYVDEKEIDNKNRQSWRKSIAYVTQEVYLFHDTIRENLSWVNEKKYSDDELWQVLNLAAAKEFVENLPHGLNTVIGDRGIRLSGGERQRLALARALLSQPKLLILDEATSALDIDNERKIQQALTQLKGKLTIIIIAHSKETIEHVDHKLELHPKTIK